MCPGGSRSLAATCFRMKAIDLVLVGTIYCQCLGYLVVCEFGTACHSLLESQRSGR